MCDICSLGQLLGTRPWLDIGSLPLRPYFSAKILFPTPAVDPFYLGPVRTRTNTNPNDTKANAAGRSGRACVAQSGRKRGGLSALHVRADAVLAPRAGGNIRAPDGPRGPGVVERAPGPLALALVKMAEARRFGSFATLAAFARAAAASSAHRSALMRSKIKCAFLYSQRAQTKAPLTRLFQLFCFVFCRRRTKPVCRTKPHSSSFPNLASTAIQSSPAEPHSLFLRRISC